MGDYVDAPFRLRVPQPGNGLFSTSSRVAPQVQTVVHGHPEDPSDRPVAVQELRLVSDHTNEHLVRRVSARLMVTQDPETPPVDRGRVEPVQLGDLLALSSCFPLVVVLATQGRPPPKAPTSCSIAL